MLGVPGATLAQQHQASLRDVAPTILRLLGLPAGPEMQGETLDGMIDQENYGVAPSDDDVHAPVTRRPTPLAASASPSQQVTQRLRELGYLE